VRIPLLTGALAAFALTAAAILRHGRLAIAALVAACVAVSLGIETEVRYHACMHAPLKTVRFDPTQDDRINYALSNTPLPARVELPRSCERWPW
jgi:hypothetical protein